MATSPQAFYGLWQSEAIRDKLFELLSKEDICSVRIANSACCNLVTKRLFIRTNLIFTANTFTKPSRVQALTRIGHHIEHLSFSFTHSDATFLPPLIHPSTGKEISYLYTPHTSMASVLARPKYGNSELGDILTQQYPPLFHAATNVPSFMNAMKHIPNMRHLTIKTPGQDPKERYRRDIVDYALVSLRIALERTAFPKLTKLSLSGVHPTAFNYLRPAGFGSSPSGARRWHQIRKLYISVESWDFYGSSPGLDHLKIMDDYIRLFSATVEKFHFTWLGRRGPCPLALSADPLFAPPRNSKKLFAEVTSPMSPLPPRPSRRPLVMPRLRYMQVRNATMNAPQLRDLVTAHKQTVREFDFENVVLINNGSWDEALAPLQDGSSGSWSRHSIGGSETSARPGLVRSPSGSSGSAVAAAQNDQQLQSASAAATAASKELFDVDLEGMMLGGPNDVDVLEAGVEEWARGVTAAAQDGSMVDPMPSVPEAKEGADNTKKGKQQPDDCGLASDIEAAKEASMAFSTKLKKRRIRKKKSHRHHRADGSVSEAEEKADSKPTARSEAGSSNGKRHHTKTHKHSHSDETYDRSHSRSRNRSHSRHRDEHHDRHHRRRRYSDEAPEVPSMPEFIADVLASDDEAAISLASLRNKKSGTYSRPRTPQDPVPDANISVPILNQDPLPVLLQPTVYDPSFKTGPLINNQSTTTITAQSSPSKPSLARTLSNHSHKSTKSPFELPTLHSQTTLTMPDDEDDLSPIQRHIEASLLLAAEREAQDAALRTSALRRAREAVLAKLSREFVRRKAAQPKGKDSAAVSGLAGMSALSLGTVMPGPVAGGRGSGGLSRFREGLFGRSIGIATGSSTGHGGGCGGYGAGNGSCMGLGGVRADSHRATVESASSVFVPLMFSRS